MSVEYLGSLFGGSNGGTISDGDTYVYIGKCKTRYVYGGCDNGGKIIGNTHVIVDGKEANIGSGDKTVRYEIYGGSRERPESSTATVKYPEITGSTNLTIKSGVIGNRDYSTTTNYYGNIYGGSKSGSIGGDANVTVEGGIIKGNVYGGSKEGSVAGSTNVNISGGTIGYVSNTYEEGRYTGDIYAGGINLEVKKTATITITGGRIKGNIYGGSVSGDIGSESDTSKNVKINISGTAKIGYTALTSGSSILETDEENTNGGNIYGGSITGTTYIEPNITIEGGTIRGSIYGKSSGVNSSIINQLHIENSTANIQNNVTITTLTLNANGYLKLEGEATVFDFIGGQGNISIMDTMIITNTTAGKATLEMGRIIGRNIDSTTEEKVENYFPKDSFNIQSEDKTNEEGIIERIWNVGNSSSLPEVYVDGTNGNDANNGETIDSPLKTLQMAYRYLLDEGGTIVICGETEIENWPGNAKKIATITSTGEASTLTLKFPTTGSIFSSQTTFENIKIVVSGTTKINANENELYFNEGVTIENGDVYLDIIGVGEILSIQSGQFRDIEMFSAENESNKNNITIGNNSDIKITNINNLKNNISNEITININAAEGNSITTNFNNQEGEDTLKINIKGSGNVTYQGTMNVNELNIQETAILNIHSNVDAITAGNLSLNETAGFKILHDEGNNIKNQDTFKLNGNFVGGGTLYLTDQMGFTITGTVSNSTPIIEFDDSDGTSWNNTYITSDVINENYILDVNGNYVLDEDGNKINSSFMVDNNGTTIYWDYDSVEKRWSYGGINLVNNIYIHAINGSDENSGFSGSPVQTFKKAFEIVNGKCDTTNTKFQIILLSDIELTSAIPIGEGTDTKKNNVNLTIKKSQDITNDITVKVTVTSSDSSVEFNCNTVLDDITLSTTGAANSSVEFFANGYTVEFGRNIKINSDAGLYPIVYGGSESGEIEGTNLTILSGTYNMIYGGSKAGTITGDINLTIGDTDSKIDDIQVFTENTEDPDPTFKGIFGGSNNGSVTRNVILNINAGEFDRIYGGGNEAAVGGNITLNYNAGITKRLYGGGKEGTVTNEINVIIGNTESTNKAIISKRLRGAGEQAGAKKTKIELYKNSSINNGVEVAAGGYSGNVKESKIIIHDGTTVNCDVYGGGWGSLTDTENYGKSDSGNVVVNGGTVNGSIFGGGHYGRTGTTNVEIKGGTITGDVYGGGYSSVVTGDTKLNITPTAGNSVEIGGGVFGGGKSNTAGSENYDFSFVSVEENTNVNINGENELTIGGSIFASGNAATIKGTGTVNIANFGTSEANKIVSIQRANTVTIDNSNIRITGTTDRTNDNSATNYTLNRIGNLTLNNNSTLYLDYGVNLVENLSSQDSSGGELNQITDGTLQIGDTENKIFLQAGKNIILKDELNKKGTVTGMFFLGQYKLNGTSIDTGIYDGDKDTDDGYFDKASYVQAEYTNDDGKECFYTYIINGTDLELGIINPTVVKGQYTQWIITGKTTDIYYEKELIASKYSVQSQAIIELNELIKSNQKFSIGYMGTEQNKSGKLGEIEIYEQYKEAVKFLAPDKIVSTGDNPNDEFGLTMYTGEQGWKDRYETSFTNIENEAIIEELKIVSDGDEEYYSDASENKIPELIFNFVHSKNITEDRELGKVSIYLNVYDNDKAQYTNIIIELNLLTRMDSSTINYYEGAIAPGAKFDVFPSVPTNITKNSDLSIYYSLYLDNAISNKATVYKNNRDTYSMYHCLAMTQALPKGTKIILIDKSTGTNEYYYHIVSDTDTDSTKTEYKFNEFYKMGTDSTDKYSNDEGYFNDNNTTETTDDYVIEEFIVQISFADAGITTTYSNNMTIKFRSDNNTVDYTSDDETIYELNTLYNTGYTVHADKETTKLLTLREEPNLNISLTDTTNATREIKSSTTYTYATVDGNVVYDTTNFDNKLGLKITFEIINADNTTTTLSKSDIEGLKIMNGLTTYSVKDDGSIRIPISNVVSNINSDLEIDFQEALNKFDSGNKYQIVIAAIGSIDGESEGNGIGSITRTLNFYDDYGLKVNWEGTNPQNYQVIDKETGYTLNGDNKLNFNIEYNGNFSNPNIKVAIERRDYSSEYNTNYTSVTLGDYFIPSEYKITTETIANTVTDENGIKNLDLTMELKDNTTLTSGTYKIKFILSDAVTDAEGNVTYNEIGEVYKMIIIR